MKTNGIQCLVVLLLFSFTSLPAVSRAAEIRLSVAASMIDAIKELAAAYTGENPGVTLLPNFGSSGSLAKQIAQGAPADLFISANTKWMDYLVTGGMVDRRTVRFFAANSLVFVGSPQAGIASLEALPSLSRIAIGSPKSVPAGQYAEQAMRSASVYEKLLASNKLVMAKDVRQALLYADRGEVDGAFVYKTDALLTVRAAILFTVPPDQHDPIDYPVGLTPQGESNGAAKSFYDFLTAPPALQILGKFGFSAPSSPPTGSH